MSDFLDQPDVDPDSQARRRALWGLAVLACAAVIIVSLMLLLGGSGGGSHDNANPVDSVPATSARATTSPPASSTGSSSAASSTPTVPPRTGNPCTSPSSCTVDGDGGVLDELNAYRTRHGRPAVPGTVTPDAQTCALHKGNGPTCKPHYIWTVASAQSGAQAVAKLSGFGSSWLLDAKVSSFAVGWAYTGGSYQCVVLKTLTGE